MVQNDDFGNASLKSVFLENFMDDATRFSLWNWNQV